MSLCVDVHPNLHTRRSSTQNDIYQVLHWNSYSSCWRAHGCLKHVQNRNKQTWKNLCIKLVYLQRLLYMLCINSIKCLYVKVNIKMDFPLEAEHYRHVKCTVMLTTPNINYCQWQIMTTLIIFCDMSKTGPCCMYKAVLFK